MASKKRKFIVNIVLGYGILLLLFVGLGVYAYKQFQVFSPEDSDGARHNKLLLANNLLTSLHEAETLSNKAIQFKRPEDFEVYASKVDSIRMLSDSLKLVLQRPEQQQILDSVLGILESKLQNKTELLALRNSPSNQAPIDNALKKIQELETSMGRIPPEQLVQDFNKLPAKTQETLQEYAAYLSKHVPKDSQALDESKQVDSVIHATKTLLLQAQREAVQSQLALQRKELEINRMDVALSRQLNGMVSLLEGEVLRETQELNLEKQAVLDSSGTMARYALFIGLGIMVLFSFLAVRDYWQVQNYKDQLEVEKQFSEGVLKSREQLIATVSHDLKTPLSTILGNTQLLQKSVQDPQQEKKLVGITKATQYVHRLTQDLLDFSKLEAGKLTVENRPFRLDTLLQETLDSLSELYKDKALQTKLNVDPNIRQPFMGDSHRIQQILTNLMGNAFKFTSQGRIWITATAERSGPKQLEVSIAVTDSGIGIKPEALEIIFEEFTQINEQEKKSGYGLGLTISKQLATLLGGGLSVSSTYGKGSTFTLSLPLPLWEGEFLPEKPESIADLKTISLLLLEDDPALLQVVQQYCKLLGVQYRSFTQFDEVPTEMDWSYDMVLTDIEMPGTNGFEVLQKLKSGAYPHYNGQPIMAMTGNTTKGTSVYIDAGFTTVLYKPFDHKRLAKTLGAAYPESNTAVGPLPDPKGFDIQSLTAFVDEPQGLMEILNTFRQNLKEKKNDMQLAVNTKNWKQLGELTHNILPMCRQLKVEGVLEELEVLEKYEDTDQHLEQTWKTVAPKLGELTQSLEDYLNVTLPNYTD